jgi:hypothetical protein
VRSVALLLAAGLALSACGETPRPATEPRVKLKLDLPDDGRLIRDDNVLVRGTVTPADAAVLVAGVEATVDGGRFSASVKLVAGGNVIDVTATSPGRRPATDAVRVLRDMRVEVPTLRGQSYTDAVDALKQLKLTASEDRGGSWLDKVLGTQFRVCTTQPVAGSLVQPNSNVVVSTGPDC